MERKRPSSTRLSNEHNVSLKTMGGAFRLHIPRTTENGFGTYCAAPNFKFLPREILAITAGFLGSTDQVEILSMDGRSSPSVGIGTLGM